MYKNYVQTKFSCGHVLCDNCLDPCMVVEMYINQTTTAEFIRCRICKMDSFYTCLTKTYDHCHRCYLNARQSNSIFKWQKS